VARFSGPEAAQEPPDALAQWRPLPAPANSMRKKTPGAAARGRDLAYDV